MYFYILLKPFHTICHFTVGPIYILLKPFHTICHFTVVSGHSVPHPASSFHSEEGRPCLLSCTYTCSFLSVVCSSPLSSLTGFLILQDQVDGCIHWRATLTPPPSPPSLALAQAQDCALVEVLYPQSTR